MLMFYLKNKFYFKIFPIVFLVIIVGIFFKDYLIKNYISLPADTIIGMYHPWRDVVWDGFNNGVPFKNFLITDPVRQQYPWRELVIQSLKIGQKPLWNPYNFSGTPLLASFQSAVYYPLNIIFFIFDFINGWQILIMSQLFLTSLFMYFFLKNEKLSFLSAIFGSLIFTFSGFSLVWLEWGTIISTTLWLPLVLLATKKIINFNFVKSKKIFLIFWSFILTFSFTASFLAGHLQVFFYLLFFWFLYAVYLILSSKYRIKSILILFFSLIIFLIIASIQWQPTLEFINLSARNIDQADWNKLGWFIPWQHLIQFFAPDYFGNPVTLNYWSVFNYAEFVGFIGIIPLVLFFNIFKKISSKIIFYFSIAIISLSFALPTPWAKLPYILKLPLLSTSQPTRLLFIVDFCLAILAAIGLERFLQKKISWIAILLLGVVITVLSGFTFIASRGLIPNFVIVNYQIALRNLFLPLVFFVIVLFILLINQLTKIKAKYLGVILILLTIIDLFRFGWKFNPTVKKDWIFPTTKTIDFLKQDTEIFRVEAIDKEILPPNFAASYHLSTISGYDPIYLLRYGQLIAAEERGQPNINPPFGFNRIINPQQYNNQIVDLLNVKYVLSLSNLQSPKLSLVFTEGQTKTYLNKNYFPRVFLVNSAIKVSSDQEAIDKMFDSSINLKNTAIVYDEIILDTSQLNKNETTQINSYENNRVEINVSCDKTRLLILTDSFYPTWKATIDGKQEKIYLSDYNFRGVVCPPGKHSLIFENK